MKQAAIIFVGAGSALTARSALAAEDGLPQFNTSLFPEQLFWLFISFTALYLLMRFVALPGVERTQGKRKGIIDDELNRARSANDQAKAMGAAADKALAEARAKAQATIGAMKAEASQTAAEEQAAQHRQLGQRLREAETGIASVRDAALKDIETVAAGLASAIVAKVSGLKAGA